MCAMRRVSVLQSHVLAGPPAPGASSPPRLSAEPTSAPSAAELLGSYDFVVVGGGSAGCVVASRLSEDPSVSVLLVEAGPSNQVFAVRSPFFTCPSLQNSERDWAFRSVPQEKTDGRVSCWPRGKTLGGCSSINYMLYVRGDPRNYDQWAQELGCEGWSYDEVLPYFLKSENYVGSGGAEGFHGKGGPLSVSHMKDGSFSTKDVSERFVASCIAAGVNNNEDYNGATQAGASLSQVTVQNGARCDTASAYLFQNGAVDRPNLTVLTGHTASRLLLEGTRAAGVCLRDASAPRRDAPELVVRARREVVVCAGAVGTPWLLMLSGIGPADHLREHGIEVVADLPVGQNLQDHLFVPCVFGVKPGRESSVVCDRSPMDLAKLVLEYALLGRGQGCYPYVTAMAFFRSGVRPEKDGNDLQIHFVPLVSHDQELAKNNFGFELTDDRPANDMMKQPMHGVTVLPSLLRPFSAGRVTLSSADPSDYPTIDPRYLEEESDMQALVDGFKFVRQVIRTGPFAEVIGDEHLDESIPHAPEEEEYIRERIRRSVVTIYHPAGTARMGQKGDAKAVVSPSLLVHGLTGLRIADASVMPTVVSGNTNAPCIMIGERAADLIKRDWGLAR